MNRIRKKEEQPAEAVKPKGKVRMRLPRGFISVLNGSFLTREKVLANMPFILFSVMLMLMYISYGYYTERTVRELHRMDAELKELRSEHISVRARLDLTEQQSKVANDISGLGLRESRVPPFKIQVENERIEQR